MAERDLTIVLGMFRSGSTWAYNVARALNEMIRGGVCGFYAEVMDSVPATALLSTLPLVVKAHYFEGQLRDLLPHARVIFTVRDPRDAVVSLMDLSKINFEDALVAVSRSIAAIEAAERLTQQAITLRYEHGDIGTTEAVLRIAAFLHCEIQTSQAEAIAERLSAESVQRTITDLQEQGVIGPDDQPTTYDAATHWHPRHVKDGRVGKYAERLSSQEQLAVVEANLGFMRAQYPAAAAAPPMSLPATISFGRLQGGIAYCRTGFSYPEEGATWTTEEVAIVEVALDQPLSGGVDLTLWFTPAYLTREGNAMFSLSLNGVVYATRNYISPHGGRISLDVSITDPRLNGVRNLEIKFNFPDVISPEELGLSGDPRKLGIMLAQMSISCPQAKSASI